MIKGKKKTLIIEISELTKGNEIVIIDESNYLLEEEKEDSILIEEKYKSLRESGLESMVQTDDVSYIKLDFKYFEGLFTNDGVSDVLSKHFNLELDDKGKPNFLYNQFLFIFDNIT